MLRRRYATNFACLVVVLVTVPTRAGETAEFAVTGLWQNKYITEGRDNLGNGGLLSLEGAAEWRGAAVGVWLATGDSESYDEVNIFLEKGFSAGALEGYLAYTRLEFLEDGEKDNELAAGLAWACLPWLTPAIDYTYSTEADGAFLELSLRSEITLCSGQLVIEPYVLEGVDFGYASKDYDGPNHIQVGLDWTFPLTEQVEIVGAIAHSWALRDVAKDGMGDETWAAIGLALAL